MSPSTASTSTDSPSLSPASRAISSGTRTARLLPHLPTMTRDMTCLLARYPRISQLELQAGQQLALLHPPPVMQQRFCIAARQIGRAHVCTPVTNAQPV